MSTGCNETTCFAYNAKRGNHCHALEDTDFGERKCPFFKTKEQFKAENAKYGRKVTA